MENILFSHIDDLCHKATNGEIAVSSFLNEADLASVIFYLSSIGFSNYSAYGGFENAQRKRLFFWPYWAEGGQEFYADYITPLQFLGSGYVELTHRDYLGSLTGAGFTRDVIGDICVQNSAEAIAFLDSRIASLLLNKKDVLPRISRDKISILPYTLASDFGKDQEYEGISTTIAGSRLDCVVAALCSISRERAKDTIAHGLVFLNYLDAKDIDSRVEQGDIVTIRGYGKYKIIDISEITKKGRIKFRALKYL